MSLSADVFSRLPKPDSPEVVKLRQTFSHTFFINRLKTKGLDSQAGMDTVLFFGKVDLTAPHPVPLIQKWLDTVMGHTIACHVYGVLESNERESLVYLASEIVKPENFSTLTKIDAEIACKFFKYWLEGQEVEDVERQEVIEHIAKSGLSYDEIKSASFTEMALLLT